MEDGAEILIKEEQESPADTSPPVPESLDGQESQDQQDVKAQGKS
jgi:hypothetical protein